MNRVITAIATAVLLAAYSTPSFDPASVADATQEQVTRVEPLSWWVGMKTDLQLMVNGAGISEYDVTIEGGKGVTVEKVNKAESPNYLFVDVNVAADAQPGTYYIVFSKDGESFKYPYEIAARAEGSAERKSFTTADMVYLIMPDRFANGDASNDSTDNTTEDVDRANGGGRHGGDIQGVIDHLDYISELGATYIWTTPFLEDNDPRGSYHGYAASDYYHIDSRFGSNELYKTLVEKAREKASASSWTSSLTTAAMCTGGWRTFLSRTGSISSLNIPELMWHSLPTWTLTLLRRTSTSRRAAGSCLQWST